MTIHVVGMEWEETEKVPVVNQADVLPFAPLTIFFGANDSGKSSTLRVIAEQLYGMSRRHLNTDGSTVVVSFRNDEPALRAMLTEFRTQEKPTSPEAVWAFQTLEDHPQLFADSATGLAQMLAGAPVFALMTDLDVNGRRSEDGTLSVSLVISPSHMQELPPALQAALEILHDKRVRPFGRDPGIDPRQFGHPLRPWHLGPLGKTSLPLIPKPLSIPQGVDTALKALEDAVERSRRAFRAWSGSVGLALPDAGSANPWVDVEGKPDRFVVQLLGDLELLSHSLLPPFVRSTYRFDFDSTSPVKPPGVTRMNARMSAVYQLLQYETFAKKFRVDEIASGFQLWVELAIWDMVDEVDRVTASLRLASVDAIIRSLDRPGSPAARFEALRKCWLDRDHGHAPWLCPPEERAWQLRMLIDASRDPRITPALDEVVHAVRPRLVLIDEPERHLSASVARDAARWLLRRAREGRSQFVIATHSPAFLACEGHDVRHVHVRRASNGLIHETFTPSDLKMLDAVANEMQLHHGELFGLVATIVWVEGPMDRAVLEGLCGDALHKRRVRLATFGGLGNMRSILDSPIARLPTLRFIVLVDALNEDQLEIVRASPDTVTAAEPEEMRRSADLISKAKEKDRQIEFVSHGWPDIFLALSDKALTEVAKRPWPGKAEVLRLAAENGVPSSKLKGFVADRYRLKVDEASCRYAAELSRRDSLPQWIIGLFAAIDRLSQKRKGA